MGADTRKHHEGGVGFAATTKCTENLKVTVLW